MHALLHGVGGKGGDKDSDPGDLTPHHVSREPAAPLVFRTPTLSLSRCPAVAARRSWRQAHGHSRTSTVVRHYSTMLLRMISDGYLCACSQATHE